MGRRGKSHKRAARLHRPSGLANGQVFETPEAGGEVVGLLDERISHHEVSPRLTGGDLDADWQGALSSGEEGVGGSVPTPDQDVVDELASALGVEQPFDAEVHTSEEILKDRDRNYWHLEHLAMQAEEA